MKAKAAWRIADREPREPEEPALLEEQLDIGTLERVEADLVRSEALLNALAILEELPGEAYGDADRWQITAVVGVAARECPDAEAHKLRQGLRVSRPYARV